MAKGKYATCDACGKSMKPGCGCTVKQFDDFKDRKARDRIPHDGDSDCHDCNCGPGKLHHIGCDSERCPKCKGQSISCNCSVFDSGEA